MNYPPASEVWVRGSQLAGDVLRWALPLRSPRAASERLTVGIVPLPSVEEARGYYGGDWHAIVAAADRVVAGTMRIFGTDVGLEPVDEVWHRDWITGQLMPRGFQRWIRRRTLRARGDLKRVWEVNRHQWLIRLAQASVLTEHDPRYATAARRLLASWLRANPPHRGVNWRDALEIGIRLVAWWTALPLFAPGPHAWPEWPDIAHAMQEQISAIETHLSYFSSPNTHLLGEGLALFLAGIVLPHAPRAVHWRAVGHAILDAELERQVGADGGHREKSAYYHCYALEMLLIAYLVGRRGGVPFPAAWEQRLRAMAEVLAALIRPDGSLGMTGDDDGGRLLPLSWPDYYRPRDLLCVAAMTIDRPEIAQHVPAPERDAAHWLLGPTPARPAIRRRGIDRNSVWLDEMGLGTIRTSADAGAAWCSLQGQPLGMLSAGHSHAALGSIELSLAGRQVLVDSGTYTYHESDWRDHFRRAAAHNTLTVAGLEPFAPSGQFRMTDHGIARDIQGRVIRDGLELRYELRQGEHVVRVRRQVSLLAAHRALIQDHVDVATGSSRELTWYWHLAPGLHAVRAPAQTYDIVADGGGETVARLCMYGDGLVGEVQSELVSSGYGSREAGETIVFRSTVRAAAAFACEVTTQV